MQRGEIWWANLPTPRRSEPGYRRPVLIIQQDDFNRSRIATVIAAVLTSNLHLQAAPGNVLLRSLDAGIKSECCRMMRESIQYALDNHDEALQYALQFARDMEPRLAEKFVGMYVNHYTVDAGEIVPKAAQKLLDMGYQAGLIPKRVELEFIR